MKRRISMLLAVLFCLNLFAQTKPSKGDGSEKNPYQISNAQELLWFAELVNGKLSDVDQNLSACAELTGDIDLSEVCGEGIGSWSPIGFTDNQYSGTFDGKGYGIKNLYINGTSSGLGFFGLTKYATISNLSILSGSVFSRGNTIGALAGNAYQSTISNCHNYISVSGGKFTGGIVGYTNGSTISKCHNEGDIKLNSDFGCGGICGATYGAKVSYCYNIGKITGSSRTGAIVGSHENEASLKNSFAYNSSVRLIGYDAISSSSKQCYLYDTKNDSSKDQFASGEICYLLNEGLVEPVFFQSIGFDEFPVLNGSDVVLKVEHGYYNMSQLTCEHKEKKTVAPTCMACGYNYCTKCHVKSDMVPAIPHDTVVTVTNAPTCTKIGYSTAQCSMCDLFYYYCDTVPAIPHDTVVTVTNAPTCTKIGYSTAQCSMCDLFYYYCDTVPALGHAPVQHNATCRAFGYRSECSRCSEGKFERIMTEAPTMNHIYEGDVCTVCGAVRSEKPESEGNYFIIKNARELLWFSEYVNAGNVKANARLIDDIDLSTVCGEAMKKNWIPIGDTDYGTAFQGEFDGQNHIVSNLYFNKAFISKDIAFTSSADFDADDVGLFGTNAGVIKNVGLTDVFIDNFRFAGAIAGGNDNEITHCYCEKADITNEESYAGGICGAHTGSISHCYSTAKVSSSSESTYVGGLVGYTKNAPITNCFAAPTVDVTKKNFAYIVLSNKGTNCYYTAASKGASKEGTSIFKTKDEVASGDVCYNLNKGLKEPHWAQTLGVDSLPHLYTGKDDDLVKISEKHYDCPNAPLNRIEYANYKLGEDTTSLIVYKYPEHIDENSDNKCDICHKFSQEFLDNIANIDTFRIETADDLIEFSNLVANGFNNLTAKLMADIDFSSVPSVEKQSINLDLYKREGIFLGNSNWIPIGYPKPYTGVFDGNGHIVSGLRINGNGDRNSLAGFFYRIADGAVVKDLWVRGSFVEVPRTGGICSYCDNATISGCVNRVDITYTRYSDIAGICYEMSGNSLIENCFNYGKITGYLSATGFVYSNKGGEIKNCLEYSDVLKITDSFYASKPGNYRTQIHPFEGDLIRINNNYSVVRYHDGYILNGDTLSKEQMCVLLNADGQNWGLTIQQELIHGWDTNIDHNDGLSYSVVPAAFVRRTESGIFVYPASSECLLSRFPTKTSNTKVDVEYTYPNHIDADGDGIYECCGMYHTDNLEPNSNGVYEICSAEQFVDFANAVNNGYNSLNAKMTCDIDLSDYCNEKIGNWTPIDSFAGVFDGQHHKISGLYIVSPDTSFDNENIWDPNPHNYLGLFASNYGEIKNLGIAKNCVLKSESFPIGAVCGVNMKYITSCYNEADIVTSQCFAGGITAKNDDWGSLVKNCYNSGNIISNDYEYASGIIGLSYCGWVINCCNYGETYNAITKYIECDNYKNNYTLSENEYEPHYDYNKQHNEYGVLSSTLSSGNICYALNSTQDSTVWYQTLNVDPYPVLDPTHGKVLYDEEKGIYYNYPDNIYSVVNEIKNEKQTASLLTFVVNRQVIVIGVDSFRIINMFGHDVTALNGSLADGVYVVVADGNVAKVVVK